MLHSSQASFVSTHGLSDLPSLIRVVRIMVFCFPFFSLVRFPS